jgi:antitoxin component YwqK of YwqJK toxin-antitoxin module
MTEEQYKAGVPVGEYMEYFENGQKKNYGQYQNGKKNGIWNECDTIGTIIKTVKYKNGIEAK